MRSRGKAKRTNPSAKAEREEQIRHSVKRHKKRRRRNYTLYYILIGFLLAVTGTVLSLTVFFHLETIEVVGNGHVSKETIIAASGLKAEENLFRIKKSRVERSIVAKVVPVDNAVVHRKLPHTVQITVTPSEAATVVRFDGNDYTVSWGGRVIAVEEKTEWVELPVTIGCDFTDVQLGDILDPEGPHGWDTLLGILTGIRENKMEGNVNCIDMRELSILKIYYDNRIEMKFGGLTDFSFELGRVKQLIEKNIDPSEIATIDATLRNGEYFKRRLSTWSLPIDEPPTAATAGKDDSAGRETASDPAAE